MSQASSIDGGVWRFVRLYPGTKRPIGDDWPAYPLTAEQTDPNSRGIHLGASGLIDVEEDRPGALADWQARFGTLPTTFTFRSGKGDHRLYAVPTGTDPATLHTRTKHGGFGVDLLAGARQVVAPGATAEGVTRTTVVSAPITTAPGWLMDLVTGPPLQLVRQDAPLPPGALAIDWGALRGPKTTEQAAREWDRLHADVVSTIRMAAALDRWDRQTMLRLALELVKLTPDEAENTWVTWFNEAGVQPDENDLSHIHTAYRMGPPDVIVDPGDAVSIASQLGEGAAEYYSPSGYASRMATPDQIDAEPEPPALVEGLIDADTFGLIFGPGGSGKSFVALDLALCVASGRDWHGHATHARRVCFVAAEGRRSAGRRTKAWRSVNQAVEPAGSLMIYGQPVDLFGQVDPLDWATFVAFVQEQAFGVVVIDTYNRCTPGLEENSSKDTGIVLGRLVALTRIGITVIVIHHTAKDGSKPRGSAALEWGTDWGLFVTKSGASVTVRNDRQKDHKDGGTLAELTLVEVGTSAALVVGTGRVGDQETASYRQHYAAVLDRLTVARAGRDPLGNVEQIMVEMRVVAGKAPKTGEPQRQLVRDFKQWYSEMSNPHKPDS